MNKAGMAKFMTYFGIVMVAVYIILGLVVMFSSYFKYIPQNMRIIFGIFFCAYGCFRAARTYLKYKQQKYE